MKPGRRATTRGRAAPAKAKATATTTATTTATATAKAAYGPDLKHVQALGSNGSLRLVSAARGVDGPGGAAAEPTTVPGSVPPAAGHVSIGEAIGLHQIPDPLALRSGVALVVDPVTGEILYEKNSRAVLPIASITKLMTAMVVIDAGQPLNERITIDEGDRDTERASLSRLPMGSTLTRAELLQLALMSSENRAASALARQYPGGFTAFVAAANRKAVEIGMRDSVFMDGTGLSSSNVSTARDLAVMVAAAARYPMIRSYSTASMLNVQTSYGARVFRTTNRMVASPGWDLALQKTGYINEAGNCLVIQGNLDGRSLIMVLLDSQGRYSRLGDAMRLRRYLEG
ncbi:MAG: serine hydrolase [Lautropia sp.]